jgi:alanine racemase
MTSLRIKSDSRKNTRDISSRVWLEIKKARILANFKTIRKKVKPAQIMCVLKANGYGLGALPLAKLLVAGGAHRIGVAELKEAMLLKGEIKCPIHLISGVLPWEIKPAIQAGFILPVSTLEAAQGIMAEARKQKRKTTVHVKVDTGMGRLGLTPAEALEWVPQLANAPFIQVEGIFSHFANANQPEHFKTQDQIRIFERVVQALEATGLTFALKHLANSDGINNFPGSYADLVRTGINLYGVFDLKGQQAYPLLPSLTLKTTLLARRRLKAGHTIGYGCTHTLFEDTWVGTVPAGYADGIPLAASNSSWVLIHGKRCPILGRVSMDYITINLNDCPKARVGDEVVLVGQSGRESISIEDWARVKQTHPYEIICSLGPRVQRVFV